MSDFNLAIPIVLQHEGGYVNNPNDPGGETNFGISKRAYPNLDIANLTVEQASAIYYQDWWVKYAFGSLQNQAIANKLFDTAVNIGATESFLLMQRAVVACGITLVVNGELDSVTVQAINQATSGWLLDRFRVELVEYYVGLVRERVQDRVFLLGWIERGVE